MLPVHLLHYITCICVVLLGNKYHAKFLTCIFKRDKTYMVIPQCGPGPSSLPNHQIQSATKSLAGMPLRPHACWFITLFRAVMDFLLFIFFAFFVQIVCILKLYLIDVTKIPDFLRFFGSKF